MSETIIRNSLPTASETPFNTTEKRIAEVAWRFNHQYSYLNQYLALGFTSEEIAAGNALGRAMSEEFENNRRTYGSPCYGSWPASATSPIKAMVQAMAKGDTQLYAEWSANMASAREWWNLRNREERAAQYPKRAYYDYGQSWEGMSDSMRVSIMNALRDAGRLPKAQPPAVVAPAVVIPPAAYEALARADKARLFAKILQRGGVPAVDVACMTAHDWEQFHAGLKSKGIVSVHSTVPSIQTVGMILIEMHRLERTAAAPVASPARRVA